MRGCHLEIHLTKSFLHGRFGWRLCLRLTLFISSPVALWAQQQLSDQNDRAALTAAYRGFVMDADDLPVSGVLVTSEASSKAERGELRHVREAQTRTDEFGRFELTGLRPIEMKDGARQLYFEHPDYGLAWYGRTYRDELTDTHDGLLHIQLQPGVELGGKVVLDEDGSPISGAIVSADVTYVFGSEEEAMLPARYHGLHVLTERYGRSVVTDAAGRFRLPKLPGGARLSLTVQHPGFVAYRSDQTQSAYPVSVRENSIDVELKPAVTIRGRLLADSKPIGMAGVQVSAVDRSRGQLAARTKTDNQGRFELTGLDENEYLLQTSAFTEQRKGLIGTPIAVEQRAAGSSISVNLDCTPGQVVTGMITDNQGRHAAGFGVFVRDIERLKDP